jgi:hypothetical protein
MYKTISALALMIAISSCSTQRETPKYRSGSQITLRRYPKIGVIVIDSVRSRTTNNQVFYAGHTINGMRHFDNLPQRSIK